MATRKNELSLKGVKQFYIDVEKEEWKLETLCDLHDSMEIILSVIFVNSRRQVDWLAEQLRARGYTVTATHADMDQDSRDEIMRVFRSGQTRILVTTDGLPYGFGVALVTAIINFDLPTQPEAYLHRVGRPRRYNHARLVCSFVTKDDKHLLQELQRVLDTTIEELPNSVADLLS